MKKLTSNEEKVWTILKDFPNGIRAKQLMQLTNLSKTTLYEVLNSLEIKLGVENRKWKWYPKISEINKEKHSKSGLFEWLKDRNERKRKEQEKIDKELLLRKIHYEEMLAKVGGEEWEIMNDLAAQDRETLEKLWKSKH